MDRKLMRKLIEFAKKAQKNSYSPYSRYPVGASVVGGSGKIYTGTNIENASFGLSICAERVAIFKAIANGEKSIKDICVVARSATPCGACRQVILEFADKSSHVICVDYHPIEKNKEKVSLIKVSKLIYKPFEPGKAGL
ncbi:MAG: cytidine deaminase [Elusimicrobiota bacterium]